MKINCIVRTQVEFEERIDPHSVAVEVYPEETVHDVMDRLVGFGSKGRRKYDSTAVVELRVAREMEGTTNGKREA